MSMVEHPLHLYELDPLQCGQAVIAMLTGKSFSEIIATCGTERETTLADMRRVLGEYGIGFLSERTAVTKKEELPDVALLSLETPRCWHWSLYFKGRFLDPEHGELEDFPEANRKYYWKLGKI